MGASIPAPSDAIVRYAHELARIRETRGGTPHERAMRLDAGNAIWRKLYAALEAEGLVVEPMSWGAVEARATDANG